MKQDFYDEPCKTKRQVLPYRFQVLLNGKMAITKSNSQMLIVTREQVEHMLSLEDLDVHRRKMYEAALGEFQKAETQKAEGRVQ